jgi:hypothetical protein
MNSFVVSLGAPPRPLMVQPFGTFWLSPEFHAKIKNPRISPRVFTEGKRVKWLADEAAADYSS